LAAHREDWNRLWKKTSRAADGYTTSKDKTGSWRVSSKSTTDRSTLVESAPELRDVYWYCKAIKFHDSVYRFILATTTLDQTEKVYTTDEVQGAYSTMAVSVAHFN